MEKKYPQNGKKERNEEWWRPSLIMFSRLSVWIGTPILAALFIGNWLDEKLETKPFLFLISVGIAFLVSSFGIVIEAQKALKEITNQERQKARKDKEETSQEIN